MLKVGAGAGILLLVGLYALFHLDHAGLDEFQSGLSPTPTTSTMSRRAADLGRGTRPVRTCARSAIADITADLTDFNVNQNAWISSMILYKLGLFGLDWDKTPFLDNKASFQRGIHEAVRRTTTELADNLGRVRTTSQIDADLQGPAATPSSMRTPGISA